MKPWLIAALVVVAVIVLVIRRLRGEPLVLRDVFGAPLILMGIGVYSLTKLHLGLKEALWVVLGAVVGLCFGAVRAATTRLFERDGVLWQRYTGKTFAIWVVSFAVNFGVGLLATVSGVAAEARPMTLSIGVSLLGEALVVSRRAAATGIPYAPPQTRLPVGRW